jgi:hypothetical protein
MANKHGDKHTKELVNQLVREHKFKIETRRNGTSILYPPSNKDVRPFTLHQFSFSTLVHLKKFASQNGIKVS